MNTIKQCNPLVSEYTSFAKQNSCILTRSSHCTGLYNSELRRLDSHNQYQNRTISFLFHSLDNKLLPSEENQMHSAHLDNSCSVITLATPSSVGTCCKKLEVCSLLVALEPLSLLGLVIHPVAAYNSSDDPFNYITVD